MMFCSGAPNSPDAAMRASTSASPNSFLRRRGPRAYNSPVSNVRSPRDCSSLDLYGHFRDGSTGQPKMFGETIEYAQLEVFARGMPARLAKPLLVKAGLAGAEHGAPLLRPARRAVRGHGDDPPRGTIHLHHGHAALASATGVGRHPGEGHL